MEDFIVLSALYFMPIYALIFIVTLLTSLKRIKHGKELEGIEYVCGIAFALMMWTLSSSILLSSN